MELCSLEPLSTRESLFITHYGVILRSWENFTARKRKNGCTKSAEHGWDCRRGVYWPVVIAEWANKASNIRANFGCDYNSPHLDWLDAQCDGLKFET